MAGLPLQFVYWLTYARADRLLDVQVLPVRMVRIYAPVCHPR